MSDYSFSLTKSEIKQLRANKNIFKYKIGIVKTKWNNIYTNKLYNSAINFLYDFGIEKDNITTIEVPGAFEILSGAKHLYHKYNCDSIISIGVIIKGQTPHFDYVCKSVTDGITQLNLTTNSFFIFCVLTTNNKQQVEDRCGGKAGDKGKEAAITALQMLNLK